MVKPTMCLRCAFCLIRATLTIFDPSLGQLFDRRDVSAPAPGPPDSGNGGVLRGDHDVNAFYSQGDGMSLEIHMSLGRWARRTPHPAVWAGCRGAGGLLGDETDD
jgi:hypothetical protein